MLLSFWCTEIAVTIVVGIDHDGLNNYFWVYHNELQLMLASGRDSLVCIPGIRRAGPDEHR